MTNPFSTLLVVFVFSLVLGILDLGLLHTILAVVTTAFVAASIQFAIDSHRDSRDESSES